MKKNRRLFPFGRAMAFGGALGAAVSLTLGSPAASAQTVMNATRAEFQPSIDHAATDPGGAPRVTSYLLQFFPGGSTTPSHAMDLGKPDPDGDGLIRFSFGSSLTTPLVPGTIYQAQVTAIGPGGAAASELSNPFTASACAPSLSSPSATIAAGAGTGTVAIDAGAECAWTAVSDAGWLTVTSGSSGTGAGSVEYAAEPNATPTPRSGALTIGGLAFTVTQLGLACTYTVAPAAIAVPAAGVSGSVSMTTIAGCEWTVSGMPAWIVIATANRSGAGVLAYTVTPNPGPARSATLLIGGTPVIVSQAASPTPPPPANVRIVGGSPP